MRRAIGFYLAGWILCGAAPHAQEFEVASVKPSRAAEGMAERMLRAQDAMYESMPTGFLPVKGTTVTAHNRTLAQLIAMAFRIKPSAVTGPGWITELRYDVDAKLPEGASAKESNEMLRHLLEERFGLRTHPETKTAGGYAVVTAKDGPKLTPAEPAPATTLDKEEMQRRLQALQCKRMDEMQKSGVMRGDTRPGHRLTRRARRSPKTSDA